MNEIRQICNIRPDVAFENSHRGRVYSPYGVAPTVFNYAGGGNLTMKVMEWTDEPKKRIMFLNAADNGLTARTLRTVYYKCSLANFVHHDGHGEKGIVEIYDL